MIEALLHGKLSLEQNNMEDILTSNVFGMLQYVPPELGLFRFLSKAKTIEGESPLNRLAAAADPVVYRFWPQWHHCEPDVELFIQSSDSCSYLIGIEAKYRSGKSSEAEEIDEEIEEQIEAECTDQLIYEWNDLVTEATSRHAKPVLVYLTADIGFPREQIHDSLAEHHRKRPGSPTPLICWLSWRELPGLFRNCTSQSPLRAIARMAEERLELLFFSGVTKIALPQFNWSFMPIAPT